MTITLSKRTPGDQPSEAPWRYSASWGSRGTRITDARHAVRSLLARAGHHPRKRPSHDAQLVVSELVTNAVRHAPGPGELLLEVTPDAAHLRIVVCDSSPLPPRLQAPDAGRIGGHGLNLVTRLCEQVYTIALKTGKRVVADLPLHPAAG
ncbi:ATP-binding protein [Streptomyces cyanogenus]|uniref:Histidine kinase-, DNA gyrase B-, and HSP90-like ATPase n=1 Tax=Streptomyces cyanogenus TaxID=80860 RepID=A0ABX7TYS6_STRCY|nr:ATP-binding protein [Streptomyces cyanogenus]QTE01921.1 Histidine kinase-, DNA gyrase B-, and HSP90-like ATPase [Streptomyces cyanogenus]